MKERRQKFFADLGFRLRQIRSLNQITQEALGERLGVTKQTIQRYETGEIHLPSDVIAQCATMFEVSIGYFYGELDREPSRTNANRVGLMVAAEIMELPDDNVRKGVFHLVRSINRAWRKPQSDEEAA